MSDKRQKRPAALQAVVIPLALLLAGGVYAASVVRNAQSSSVLSGGMHRVTYRVTGTAPVADVAYRDNDGSRKQRYAVPLPWSQTLRMTPGAFMYLSAQNRAEGGKVVTEIEVDGLPRVKSGDHGAFTISVADDSL